MEPKSTTDQTKIEKGEGFPQTIHDRARDAGEELHRLLISLSTAVMAVYFIALTSKVEPPLTIMQKWTVLFGIAFMFLALSFGILAWYAEMKRNFNWASAMQHGHDESGKKYYAQRDKWLRIKDITVFGLDAFFIAGITCSVIYVIMRVFSK